MNPNGCLAIRWSVKRQTKTALSFRRKCEHPRGSVKCAPCASKDEQRPSSPWIAKSLSAGNQWTSQTNKEVDRGNSTGELLRWRRVTRYYGCHFAVPPVYVPLVEPLARLYSFFCEEPEFLGMFMKSFYPFILSILYPVTVHREPSKGQVLYLVPGSTFSPGVRDMDLPS